MDKLTEIKQKYPEIAKMTMKDVIETEEFKQSYEIALKKSWKQLKDYENKTRTFVGGHPLRIMHHKGTLELSAFKTEFLKVIDKQSKLSATSRQVVATIGSMAYTKAVELLMKKYDTERK